MVLLAVMGLVALMKKSRELEVICLILNLSMIILQVTLFFILCGAPELSEFLEKKNTILVFVFVVSIFSSLIHSIIFIIKCSTKTNKEILEQGTVVKSETRKP